MTTSTDMALAPNIEQHRMARAAQWHLHSRIGAGRSMAYKPGQQRRTIRIGRREKTEGWLPPDHVNR